MKTQLVTDILKHVNEAISLRKPNKDTIARYAELMTGGTVFPPIIIGQWPKSEKYGMMGVIDGLHRLSAAMIAKVAELPVETVQYESLDQALSDMYVRNMQHGLPPTEGQRNARIKLLKQINPTMSPDSLGKQFGLHRSSIARILKDDQGEGKSGPKTGKGANASAAHKSLKPLSPKGIVSLLERIDLSLSKPAQAADFIKLLTPAEEGEDVVLDKESYKKLVRTIKLLTGIKEEIDKIV